jgi:hypothetical protein
MVLTSSSLVQYGQRIDPVFGEANKQSMSRTFTLRTILDRKPIWVSN